MLKEICSEAGITGHKTNHSLRTTGASELFEAGVPEKIIKERTGHHSLEALYIYEHTTFKQHQAVSSILASKKEMTFQEAMLAPSSLSSVSAAPTSSTPTNIFNNRSIQIIQHLNFLLFLHHHPSLLPPCLPPPAHVTQTETKDLDFMDLDLDELVSINL